MHGGDPRYVGVRIPEGEGLSGRAIAKGRPIVEPRLTRDGFPSTVRGAETSDEMARCRRPDPRR